MIREAEACAREIRRQAQDEAGHRAKFLQAEKAVTERSARAIIPTDVRAKPVEMQVGPSKVSASRTLENLRVVMKGGAFAYATYPLYGERTGETGQPRLATLFHWTAAVERAEHFAEHANLAGAVREPGRICARRSEGRCARERDLGGGPDLGRLGVSVGVPGQDLRLGVRHNPFMDCRLVYVHS